MSVKKKTTKRSASTAKSALSADEMREQITSLRAQLRDAKRTIAGLVSSLDDALACASDVRDTIDTMLMEIDDE